VGNKIKNKATWMALSTLALAAVVISNGLNKKERTEEDNE